MIHTRLFAAAALLLLPLPAFAQTTPAEPAAGMSDQPCPASTAGQWALADSVLKADWPWLCRYRGDNRAYDARNPAKVVFIGDSITEGWAKTDPALFTGGTVGRGLSGQTSPQILLRFYQDVIALHPRVVHIMIGTNDIAGNTGPTSALAYQQNIRAMADLARANGIAVVLGSIPPADRMSWRPAVKPAPQIAALNAWLRGFAAERGLVFADYHTALAGPNGELRADLGKDGVHPEAPGYAVMRPIAERAIAEAERRKTNQTASAVAR